jgi:non-specific serine/threonine protein kinase
VPAALSAFIGRSRDLAEAAALLGRVRLVTLAGAGGAGKSRLAREVAARAVADAAFPEGVWWVELAPLPPGSEVTSAVATALGVRQPAGADAAGALAAALGARRLLLVLDSCEHVVDACAALAEGLLRLCPGLTVLATSREALGVEGEVVWPVPPLAHPRAPGAAEQADGAALAASLAGYDAVRLFVERARAVQPGFALTARNAAAVAAIAARLDGLPLALELAAANVATLGVEALAARLDDAFAVLTRGRRTALPRHRTLRALLDWSYDLLGPAEQRLLARLSVFRGAFTLEQAEAVCGAPAPGGADEAGGVLAALGRLAEQSLVEVREQGGDARYRLLETVRQYGAALLRGTPDEARTRAAHAAWVAGFAARVGPRLWSVERRAAAAEVSAVYDDVQAALAWAAAGAERAAAAAAPGDAAPCAVQALAIPGALTWFYFTTGRWEDARRAYAAAAAAAERAGLVGDDASLPTEARRALASARYLGATAAWLDNAFADAVARAGHAAALWTALAADPSLGEADRRLAEVGAGLALEMEAQGRGMLGDLPPAMALIDRAVASAERAGDARHLAAVRARRGFLRVAAGDHAGADADFAAAVATYHRVGERWLLSLAYQGMAVHALVRGDAAAAVVRAQASVEAARDEDDLWFLSRGLDTLGAALAATLPGPAGSGRDAGPAPSGPRSPPPCSAPPPARAGARACGSASTTSRRRRGPWPRRASPSGPRRSTPPGRRARRSPRRRWWPTRPPSARPARPRPRGRAAPGRGRHPCPRPPCTASGRAPRRPATLASPAGRRRPGRRRRPARPRCRCCASAR